VLLDISGSMQGAPLGPGAAVTATLIAVARRDDRLELIAFATRPDAVARSAPCARRDGQQGRGAAVADAALQASGGTEMHDAILAALPAARTARSVRSCWSPTA
jgi:uncharacterized protein with von Willebrand factor type A (vWA) domain